MSAPAAIHGTLQITWWNREAPKATPRYRVIFTPNRGGGAVPYHEVVGTEALEEYFFDIQTIGLPAQWRRSMAKVWVLQVQKLASHELPYELEEDSYRVWVGH